MSAVPAAFSHQHWFLYLNEDSKKSVLMPIAKNADTKPLFQKDSEGRSSYLKALAWLAWDVKREGDEPPKDANVEQAIALLNEAAYEKVPNEIKIVCAWKQHIDDLTTFVSGFDKLSFWSAVGSVGAAGLGILYRSHRVLLVANLCAGCALWFFRSTALKLRASCDELKNVIQQLTLKNLKDFDDNLNTVYEGLAKTSYLMRFYLRIQKKSISGDNPTQQLLTEQLFALNQLCETMRRYKNGSKPLEQKDANIGNVRIFFENFEKTCRKGWVISAGITVLSAALTYHAYTRKAYLMILAGMAHCIGSLLISKEFLILERGSKKIDTTNDVSIANTFAEIVPTSKLLSAMMIPKATAYDIEQCVVIPFDAILTLVPSWKTPDN